jgi:hypothetical protein
MAVKKSRFEVSISFYEIENCLKKIRWKFLKGPFSGFCLTFHANEIVCANIFTPN